MVCYQDSVNIWGPHTHPRAIQQWDRSPAQGVSVGAEAWTSSMKGRESPWAMGGGLPCPLTGVQTRQPPRIPELQLSCLPISVSQREHQ